jgi:hypothetical protein
MAPYQEGVSVVGMCKAGTAICLATYAVHGIPYIY